jgi:hypothetical protein
MSADTVTNTTTTARATRAIIERAAAAASGKRQTGQPVRRNSRHSGTREVAPWKVHNLFAKGQNARRLRALEQHARQLREPGRPSPISATVIRIYRLLLRSRCPQTGRLDLAHATMARMLDLGVRTVQRALARLEAHGWLEWLRRTRPVDDPEPFGQQVEQDTNAYLLTLSPAATALVRNLGEAAPAPADHVQRAADHDAEVGAMLDTLSAEELAAYRAGSEGGLAAALRALGRAVDQPRNATATLAENPHAS